MKKVKDNTLKKFQKFFNWKTHTIKNQHIQGEFEIVQIRKYRPFSLDYHEVDIVFKGELLGHHPISFAPKWVKSDFQHDPTASKIRINRVIRYELQLAIKFELTKFLGPDLDIRIKKVTWV
jgi:hypothetical protein